jgi:hypothetical protein
LFWLRARDYKGGIRVVLHSACCYYDGVAAPLCSISKTKIKWNTAFSYLAHTNVCLTHEMNLLDTLNMAIVRDLSELGFSGVIGSV